MKRLIAIAAVAVLVVMVAPNAWGAQYDVTKPPPIFDRTPSIISTPIADDTPWVGQNKSIVSTGVVWLDFLQFRIIAKEPSLEAEIVGPLQLGDSLERRPSTHVSR